MRLLREEKQILAPVWTDLTQPAAMALCSTSLSSSTTAAQGCKRELLTCSNDSRTVAATAARALQQLLFICRNRCSYAAAAAHVLQWLLLWLQAQLPVLGVVQLNKVVSQSFITDLSNGCSAKDFADPPIQIQASSHCAQWTKAKKSSSHLTPA